MLATNIFQISKYNQAQRYCVRQIVQTLQFTCLFRFHRNDGVTATLYIHYTRSWKRKTRRRTRHWGKIAWEDNEGQKVVQRNLSVDLFTWPSSVSCLGSWSTSSCGKRAANEWNSI